MTGIQNNIDDMIARLAGHSRTELEFMRTLSDAIRRVDEQLLRDVRSVSVAHEIRRESILTELQSLASRLCALPVRNPERAAIDQQRTPGVENAIDPDARHGADWRQAALNIQNELDTTFGDLRH